MAVRGPLSRRRADLRPHELLDDLFPLPDLGPGHVGPRTGLGPRAKRIDRLVGYADLFDRARVDLHGDRSLCRRWAARLPSAGSIRQCGGPTLASIWRLSIPADGPVHCGERTFHLRPILTKIDLI